MDTEAFADDRGTFASRHIGPQPHERDAMLTEQQASLRRVAVLVAVTLLVVALVYFV